MSAASSQAPMTHSRHRQRFMASSIAKRPPPGWTGGPERFCTIGPVRKLHLVAAAAVGAGLLLLLQGERPVAAVPGQPDPLGLPIEYRPGCYMPPGFPLQGSVRLLSWPVVEAGKRHRIRLEYTVGEAGVAQRSTPAPCAG